jgi:hypothetical protein
MKRESDYHHYYYLGHVKLKINRTRNHKADWKNDLIWLTVMGLGG